MGAFASPAFFSFMYARGAKNYLKLNLLLRLFSFVILIFGFPYISLFLYGGSVFAAMIIGYTFLNFNINNVKKFFSTPFVSRALVGEILLSFFSSFVSGFVSKSTLFEMLLERAYRLLLGIVAVLADISFYKSSFEILKIKAKFYYNNKFGFSVILLAVIAANIVYIFEVGKLLLPIIGVLTYLLGKFLILPIYRYSGVILIVIFSHAICLLLFLNNLFIEGSILLLISIELVIFLIYGLLFMPAIRRCFIYSLDKH